jgi:predicted NBD/HSP70 family sugar kinase
VDRSPTSLESLRQANRLRVMAVLQQAGHASRADIVRASGLSRTTVSSLVAELLDERLVVERSDWDKRAPSPDGGRPATLLTLDPSSGAFLGIDFAHDSVRVVLVDRCGELVADDVKAYDVDDHPHAALNLGIRIAERLLKKSSVPRDRVLGVGAAVAAPLRASRPVMFASERIFASWTDLDIEGRLASQFGCAVHVGNDANLGALAETTFGAGRGGANNMYVMLSAGVGLGLWLRGQLYTGGSGTAGELGHVVVDPGGQVCRCGSRGCLETVAGLGALIQALRYTQGDDVTTADLLDLAATGDRGVVLLLQDAGRAVGGALAGLCSVLDPEVVIVGGELAAAGDVLLDGIREVIDRESSTASGHSYPVVKGELGARAEALGAATLAMDSESRQMLHGMQPGPSAPAGQAA